MNRIASIGLLILLQLINVKSIESASSSAQCSNKCSSDLYETDWTGELLQFKINSDDTLDNQVQEIGISLTDSAREAVFTCSRRRDITVKGSTTITTIANDKVTLVDGTSLYLNDNNLWCDWTINREDNSTFPLEYIEPAELIVTPTEYRVIIHLNETLPIAPVNMSTLPVGLIGKFEDYKVTGNSRFLLFTRMTDGIDFVLAVYGDGVKQFIPSNVTIGLNSSPYGLKVNCDYGSMTVNGELMFNGKPFWNDLASGHEYGGLTNRQIVNETICQWSIPNRIEFGSKNGIFDLKSSSLQLSIVVDERFEFFTESNFKLTSSSTSLTTFIASPLIVLIFINRLLL